MEPKKNLRASALKAIKMNCTACQIHWAGCENLKLSELLRLLIANHNSKLPVLSLWRIEQKHSGYNSVFTSF